jgi:hypothetical protein
MLLLSSLFRFSYASGQTFLRLAFFFLLTAYVSFNSETVQAQSISFHAETPQQSSLNSVTIQGTLTNNTGNDLNATDLFFNFFAYDPIAIVSIDQLSGSPDFLLPKGTTSARTGLFNVNFSSNAVPGQAYSLNVSLQDINGNISDIIALNVTAPLPAIQFNAAGYSFSEGAGGATITVTRTGNTTGAVTVDYVTVDTDTFTIGCADAVGNQGSAYGRCDYSTTLDTLHFAAGEVQKTFTIPLIDDAHVEGNETLQLRLSGATGATLGTQSTATLTIMDNDAGAAANPIFNSPFFVRLHYLDFLSREPEPNGLAAWLKVLNECPNVNNNPACDRLLVSSSFFRSQEFQLKGYFVFLFYKIAFNRRPGYDEIISDMRRVTGQTPEEVYAKKAVFTNAFAARQEFHNAYDGLNDAAYVDALLGRYSLASITTPDPANPDGAALVTLTRNDLVGRLTAQTLTRGQVLRALVQSREVDAVEYNGAFVAMQYYGYLRRAPEESGYQAWLKVINQDPNNIRIMVNGFMNSTEYRLRFGAP